MEIKNAKISILVDGDKTRIEIKDGDAAVTFIRVELTPEQLSKCLSRLSSVECKATVDNLEHVGKTHTCKRFEFPLTDDVNYDNKKEIAKELAVSLCPDGWEPDLYFGSQDSFFTKGDEQWAKCTIRRWV